MRRPLAVPRRPIRPRPALLLPLLLLGISIPMLASCLLPEARRARDLYVAPGGEELLDRASWGVGSVLVEQGVRSASLEAEARSILQVLLAQTGVRGTPEGSREGGAEELLLDATIREREFLRDYRSFNAVSLELRLYQTDAERPLAIALYSENTRETIASSAYLYAVIRKALGVLRR